MLINKKTKLMFICLVFFFFADPKNYPIRETIRSVIFLIRCTPSEYTHRVNSDTHTHTHTHTHTDSSEHTHTYTHTHTHTEQWAAFMPRHPRSSWGFRALLKGTSVVVLKVESYTFTFTPPPDPRLELTTFGLRVRLSNH